MARGCGIPKSISSFKGSYVLKDTVFKVRIFFLLVKKKKACELRLEI